MRLFDSPIIHLLTIGCVALISAKCVTAKHKDVEQTSKQEAVAPKEKEQITPAATTKEDVESKPKVQEENDLPKELRDSASLDPASNLDKKDLDQSDFAKVRKSVEESTAAREKAWADQERAENELRQMKEAEEKARLEKQAEEARLAEKKRQEELRNAANAEANRLKAKKDAEAEVAKFPGITPEESNWKGLE